MTIRISKSDLMAEKLGMIVLCKNCGKRLKRLYIARIPIWSHETGSRYWCFDSNPRFSTDGIALCAEPRPSELANTYEMEPQ